MRIAELAESVRVPTSSVRYYERIGLLPEPARTTSGYRDYDGDARTRLLFIHRARSMGLTCQQIGELLPVWNGTDCPSAQEQVIGLIEAQQAEVATRIAELQVFAEELEAARTQLAASPPPATCCADLSCCVPEGPDAELFQLRLAPRKTDERRHWPD